MMPRPPKQGDTPLTFAQALEIAGVSRKTLRKWVLNGDLVPVLDDSGEPLLVSTGGRPGPLYWRSQVLSAVERLAPKAKLIDGRIVLTHPKASGVIPKPRSRR